ncbi:hypothetical protein FRB98_004586 [Tulasnella sp. 332]|nr:hypothetical protein FRB98_004586 [Tulasnella sp. 332]
MAYIYNLSLKLEDFSPINAPGGSNTGAFGSRRGFWPKYDKVADKFDRDMMGRLDSNLDVLLIFAGLFSAVDTAFIILTLTALSANPIDQTNHLLTLLVMNASNSTLTASDLSPPFVAGSGVVRQNCLFFASLSCSLLAAAGAMLAKQWVQAYERTGQTGPLDQQGIRRTEKFIGADKWGLRPVVELLPTLLLVSLALFFAALIDYLWTIDRLVALVVLVFAAGGALLYGLMIVAAAVFPACPFQTAPSAGLLLAFSAIQRLVYAEMPEWSSRTYLRTIKDEIEYWIKHHSVRTTSEINTIIAWIATGLLACFTIPTAVVPRAFVQFLRSFIRPPRKSDHSDPDQLFAVSAVFMAEAAPYAENILTIADNLPLLSNFHALQLINHSTLFQLLLSQLRKSLSVLQGGGSNASSAEATSLAQAVAWAVLADPEHTVESALGLLADLNDLETDNGHAIAPMELTVPLLCIYNLCVLFTDFYTFKRLTGRGYGSGLGSRETLQRTLVAKLRAGIPQGIQFNSLADLWFRHCVISSTSHSRFFPSIYEITADVFLAGEVKVDVAYLTRALHAMLATLRRDAWLEREPDLKSAWHSFPGEDIHGGLFADYFDAFSGLLESGPTVALLYAPCHGRLLVHLDTLFPSYDPLLQEAPGISHFNRMHRSLNRNIELLVHCGRENNFNELSVDGCRIESIRTLQHLLLTPDRSSDEYSVYTGDLVTTASLASCIMGHSEKEQLLQGVLYSLFLKYCGVRRLVSNVPDALEARSAVLQQGILIGPILSSALRLYLWLHPPTSAIETWTGFSEFMRLIDSGQTGASGPPVTATVPEAWGSAVEVAHAGEPLGDDNIGAYYMKRQGGIKLEERGEIWNAADGSGAGMLFLRAWDTATNTDPPSSTAQRAMGWASLGVVEAFAVWLSSYDWQEVVAIRQGDVVYVQATFPRALVIRFIQHALKENPSVAVEFGLSSALEEVMVGADRDAIRSLRIGQRLLDAVRDARDRTLRRIDPTTAQWWKYGGMGRVCGIGHIHVL